MTKNLIQVLEDVLSLFNKSQNKIIKNKKKKPADLDKIISVYEALLDGEKREYADYYNAANCLITDKETIQKFVALLPKYQKIEGFSCSGNFISGLINNLDKNEEIYLDLTNLETMCMIGNEFNCKLLRVKGNAGMALGFYMKGGKIIADYAGKGSGFRMQTGEILINHDVEDCLGYSMNSGKIIVKGNAGDEVGRFMEGGIIVVEGDAGRNVGQRMHKGEIYLNGDYESISTKIGFGKIYHKGKRIR